MIIAIYFCNITNVFSTKKTIFMKNLILTLLITVCATTISSAQTLDYTTWQSYKVITLSLRNLITIVDCSSNQFSALMKNYGYWPSKDLQGSDYTHKLYENNSIDLYLDGNDGLGVNYIELSEAYHHAQIFGGLSKIYPRNALVNLRNALTPYYRDTTKDGIERFVIEEGRGRPWHGECGTWSTGLLCRASRQHFRHHGRAA